jgi:hypothetical protein
MSLTDFLKDKDVKAIFADEFQKPKGKIAGEIKAPLLTNKPPMIGTAFDYLMRFHLKYHNPDAITDRWVAEGACARMEERESVEYYAKAKSELDFATNAYNQFLNDGILTDDLLKSSLMLAHLDMYYRAGRDIYDIPMQIEPEDIQDLKNLINIVDFDLFKAKKHCLLNPIFNEGSYLVGGADADLVIDNMMIDIKTTKNLSVTRDIFNQIVGYYLLGVIGGIGEEKIDGSTIDKIGVYFSRHGILHLYDVNEIIDSETLPVTISILESMAEDMFHDDEYM